MFAKRIKPGQLIDRINAEANAPEFVENAALLASCGMPISALGSLVTNPINNSIRNVSDEFSQGRGTIPMFRPADMSDSWLSLDSAPMISREFEANHSKARVFPGDIVLAIAGTVGLAARVPIGIKYGNINGSCARIRPISGLDGYLLSYLNSKVGNRALMRFAVGSVQKHLNLEDLPAISVVLPSPLVRLYIGDKVRWAERLRARARELESQFQAAIREICPEIFGPIQEKGRHSRTKALEVDGNLNPGAYNPERLRIRKTLQSRGGKSVISLAHIETPVSNSYHPNDLYVGLDAISSSNSSLSPATIANAEVEGTVRVLQEGPVISKLRPYLNKASYIPRELVGAYGSTELLCLRPKTGISGWYLYGVLKLESTIRQLNPIATGATHPRVTRDDVATVIVPWLEEQEELGGLLERSQLNYFTSERLTIAAKLLVEALIEGKVTEAELKEAQESLERGDRAADRSLLSRLTRKGMDAAGEPPLFPDLAALYDALDQTATDAASKGVPA